MPVGTQPTKEAKTFGLIACAAFVVLHAIVIAVSANRFGILHQYPALIAVSIAAAIWLVVDVVAVLKDAWFATENNWPHILLITLGVASLVVVAYCPAC